MKFTAEQFWSDTTGDGSDVDSQFSAFTTWSLGMVKLVFKFADAYHAAAQQLENVQSKEKS